MTIFECASYIGAALAVMGMIVLQKRATKTRRARRGAVLRIIALLERLPHESNTAIRDGGEHNGMRI